jgi:hypothetical protein
VEEVVDVRHLLKRAGVLDGHEGAHTAAHEQATHNPVVSLCELSVCHLMSTGSQRPS